MFVSVTVRSVNNGAIVHATGENDDHNLGLELSDK